MTPKERWDYYSTCIYEPKHRVQYSNHLARLDQLAENQDCFDDFASEIMRLSQEHMFDPSSNNALIDVKNQKINIIDPTTKENAEEYQCHGNHLAGMLGCLLDPRYVARQSEQARKRQIDENPVDTEPRFVNIRKKVLKKCLSAAKKADMSFAINSYKEGSSNHDYYNLNYLFKMI